MMIETWIASIQVGLPRRYDSDGAPTRQWRSAILKEPVNGPIWLGRLNLDGDRQADLKNHGGPDQAVLAYGASHYPGWRNELNRPDFPHGAFGENFTIVGQDESSVCVGDVYAIGDAVVQVTKPRVPCWKISYRHRIADLTTRVERTGRTGWYLRVLQEGVIEAGQAVTLVERHYQAWSINRVAVLSKERQPNCEDLLELVACESLATDLRARLQNKLDRLQQAEY
jgi:MOSC domain-containing protein YiiM